MTIGKCASQLWTITADKPSRGKGSAEQLQNANEWSEKLSQPWSTDAIASITAEQSQNAEESQRSGAADGDEWTPGDPAIHGIRGYGMEAHADHDSVDSDSEVDIFWRGRDYEG